MGNKLKFLIAKHKNNNIRTILGLRGDIKQTKNPQKPSKEEIERDSAKPLGDSYKKRRIVGADGQHNGATSCTGTTWLSKGVQFPIERSSGYHGKPIRLACMTFGTFFSVHHPGCECTDGEFLRHARLDVADVSKRKHT